MAALTPASDTRAADWIVAALTDFAKSVLSVVPGRFPAYVRIFHPAYRREGHGLAPVRWDEIAAANGTQAHAGMQLCAITGSEEFEEHGQPGVFDGEPLMGSLPSELIDPLVAVLRRHTATPDRCWFAVWLGWGALGGKGRSGPLFSLPGREYHLLTGPVEAATESLDDYPARQSANLWWPDDRAWCVATEVDFKTTYLGCPEACRDEILERPELEAFEIDPAHGIDWRSDRVNPVPREN